jgi:hypothetical protein
MKYSAAARVLLGLASCGGLCSASRAFAEAREAAREVAPPAGASETANTERTPVAIKNKPEKTAHKSHSKKSLHHTRQPTLEYRRVRDAWHAPVAEPVAPTPVLDEQGRPPLVIDPVNGGERVTLTPQRADGGFSAADLQLAARAFAPQGAHEHPISPHLLDLVYRAMRHFDAALVHLVSGYRRDRAGSRHTQGRAIDMVLPGVSNDDLAEHVRQYGFVGVGIYPKSGFVHLDVRDSSYFWVDNTLPDEHSRCEPILGEVAAKADRDARERGETPETFVPDSDHDDRAADRVYRKRAQHRRAAAASVGAL